MVRTTVSIDPDVAALLEAEMRERGISFKAALNGAIRQGLRGRRGRKVATPVFSMGAPAVPIDRALLLAADLEDAETARRLALRK
jgi:hypothetical protein